MTKKYVTTAIPYMNGEPHIGHAMDYCLADVCARYYRMCGDEVRLQAGADEHGSKIWQKAIDEGVAVQDFVNLKTEGFVKFISKLGVEYTDYVRTTDKEHERRVQEIWRRLSDHIYMDTYEGWYCTGCERFITDKEYEENGGICPDHQKPYEKLAEKNYYLRIADFKEKIKKAIESDEMLVLPEFRKKEILKLLADSPDVSISRPRTQLEWGVPVPGDESQVMYVWMDALANYLTVIGYPDADDYQVWWPAAAQFVGKDILRFHAIIWPAMLLGLGLELPKVLVSHGMVLADGQKMSKSIGNVVNPAEVIDKYGPDAFRYFFLRHVDTFADSDFTWEKFERAYETELANDLGNLVQRLATMCVKNDIKIEGDFKTDLDKDYSDFMDKFEYTKAFDYVWGKVQELNKRIDEEKPWVLAKNGETEKLRECLSGLVKDLLVVNQMLQPFLPATASKITEIFAGKIEPPKMPLFPKQ
ncbi:methionine--tRNA ligase [Candidatus Saccharibacteria bacterium]|nr:methionine--tRNA ligase [Candidatus Saccharibacteria bacterium]